jgi:hypothetical protein
MNIAEERYNAYLANKKLREEGHYIGVPLFKKFPRLANYFPTIPKSTQIMLTAGSGVGKTQSWIGLLLLPTYELIKEEGIKVKFLINLLEDPIELFIDRLYSAVMVRSFGIVADGLSLNSAREKPLSNEVINFLPRVKLVVEDILNYCIINESIMNPTGIYKWCRNISGQMGTHYYEEREFKHTDEFNKVRSEKVQVYSHYEPSDDTQVIVIMDNLNNLAVEQGNNQLQTINKWTRDYGRMQITKHWGWTIYNILQQSAESESQEYFKGQTIIDKIEPSLDGLGNSRECQRDHLLILGLFSPARYGIANYYGYEINKLGDNFRAIKILKSNISAPNTRIPFYFNGACSIIKELPKANEMTETIYTQIQNGKY